MAQIIHTETWICVPSAAPPITPAHKSALLAAALAAAMLLPGHAFASSVNCDDPSSSHSSCTIPAGTYTSTPDLSGSGDNGGDDGPDYTLTNNGTINISSGQQFGLAVKSSGHDGSSSNPDAGAGGDIVIDNNGAVTLQGSSSDTIYGLYAHSDGGDGSSNVDNGDDGGRGGDGGDVGITNTADITINQSLPNGAIGIDAESKAGMGGDQNSSVFGDQVGGNSGDAKDITISNSGGIFFGASNAFLHANDEGWGIGALAEGNTGGEGNGKGGTGGNITIGNTGGIAMYWNGTDGTPDGLRGIYALSEGGDGVASTDDSDKGGNGEAGYQVQITNSGEIQISSEQSLDGLSAGIVGVSEGGNGGAAPGGNVGGNGADGSNTTGGGAGLSSILLNGGSEIVTTGENISGVVLNSQGGNGGNGQDGEHNSSGGNGGAGGAVEITLADSAIIFTSESGSFGAVAQSIGGSGGAGGDNTALLGQSGGAGFGGNGGSASFTGGSNTAVFTTGDFSSAVVIQSIGGNGGTAGNFDAVLGGAGGDGGNGGDAGSVSVTSSGALQTSGNFSHGILAQSIAGSGGTGAIPSGTFSLGGDGGSGGDAGNVGVTNTGNIGTSGLGSRGIIAQSISGGGGDAGISFGGGGLLVIGGDSGLGGGAGDVTVSNAGSITTGGDAATGLLAQSIGGGGGSAAGNTGIESVGGSGGGGGDGGTVNVADQGSINTGGAWANGITAQSIGGGGGDGGNTLDINVIAGIGVGGDGGVPGSSSDVTVGNLDASNGQYDGTPSIATSGDHAYGILAQSIGGGGGSGGTALGGGLDVFTLQVGGDPADGAKGNDVRVQFQNLTLTTAESDGIGIAAQSIGGGGGVGGSAFSGAAFTVFTNAVAVGGSGGTGGDGDTVTVDLTGSAVSTGVNADPNNLPSDSVGILAQSIGGGGGVGGHAFSAALAAGVGPEVPLTLSDTLSVGGSGGAGGNGDFVNIALDGSSISTVGASSDGILAQSVGGGGGHAGMGWTYAVGEGLGGTAVVGGVGVAVGGSGGASGDGSTVTIGLSDKASIMTNGEDADAIVAQSIGGGGGDGGAASTGASGSAGISGFTIKTAVGGHGGGGSGGAVNVTLDSTSAIVTEGGDSQGIIAQSIGGGGGTSQGISAGGSIRAGDEVLGGATLQGNLSVGLQGGTGGDANDVTVNDQGSITTQQTGSLGVIAQSIGGGGGIGGSVAADTLVSGSAVAFYFQAYELGMGIGGAGGTGGNGGNVTVNQSGLINTSDDFSTGLLAQSVGGGGGMGGSSVTNFGIFHPTAALDVTVGGTGGDGGAGQTVIGNFNGATINTAGYMADGAVLQSVGGGGGIGADASDSAQGFFVIGGDIGGNGGSGNDSGNVAATGSLTIKTTGADAIGLLAQSVGGGGGIGGQGNATASINPTIQTITLEMAVGGSGGDAGDGGQVQVGTNSTPFDAQISTQGARAYGLVAQSVGGGGGIGGAGSADNYTSVTLGGQGGATGNGGKVEVITSSNSSIETVGAGAEALVAQSVGGGGGIGGDVSSPGISFTPSNSSVTGHGNGGNVEVDSNGYILAYGPNSYGIFAQSVGGGGGFGGDASGSFAGSTGGNGAKGSGGAVTVNQPEGTIYALGANGIGIFAQSEGPSGGGQINVNVQGTVYGDANGGAAIEISGGNANVLTDGPNSLVDGEDGTAIVYTSKGSTSDGSVLFVNNEGDIEGSVLLTNKDGDQAGVVDNNYHGTLNSQLIEASVVNTGNLIVGGRGQFGTTRITGDFQQSGTGTLQLDSDFAGGRVGRLQVDGNAQLGGGVTVLTQTLLPRALPFLQVGGATSGSLQGNSSGPFSFNISQSGDTLTVAPEAQFAQPGQTEDEAQAASELQSIWNAGGGNFSRLFSAINDAGSAAYTAALARLNTDTVSAPATQNLALTAQRLDRLMSCPSFMQGSAMVEQTQCVWAQISGHSFGQSMSDGENGYNDATQAYTIGGQAQFAPNWFVGGDASYESSQIGASGGGFDSSGQTFSAGATIKHELGNWLLGGAMSGNFGSFSNTRLATVDGLGGVAKSDQNIDGLGWRMRAAYSWASGSVYLKPYVDLDVIYTRAGAYSESGAGLLNQQIAQNGQWAVVGSPSLEAGQRFDIGSDYVLRGHATAGISVSSVDQWSTPARLSAAPATFDGFNVTLPMDNIYGRFRAGLQLASTKNGLNLRLEYDGMYGAHSTQNGGSLRLSWLF